MWRKHGCNTDLRPGCLALLFLAGCATEPLGTGVGVGRSTGAVYRNVRDRVLALDAARAPECGDRRVVFTEVTGESREIPAAIGGARETWLPEPAYAGEAYVERWVVLRCGTRVAYEVVVRPGSESEPEIRIVPPGDPDP